MTARKPPYSVLLSLPWLLLFGEDGGGDGASTVGRCGTDRFQRSGGRRGSLCEHCNYIRGKAMARKERQRVVGSSIQYVSSLSSTGQSESTVYIINLFDSSDANHMFAHAFVSFAYQWRR